MKKDEKKFLEEIQNIPCRKLCSLINSISKVSGQSITKVCREIGIARTCYYLWQRGVGKPSQENATKVILTAIAHRVKI